MATVTVHDPVFNVISIKQFQTFQKETLVSKSTRVFDKLGYYVVFSDDNDILVTKYQLSKSLVEPFEHPVLNQYEFCHQLHKYLDIIYAFYANHHDYLSKLNIQFDFIDVQIKSIKNWLISNEFYFSYLIIINEYLVCIQTPLDSEMLENISKVEKYDSGEDQMVPFIKGDVLSYKQQLNKRIGKYSSNIKLYNFKIKNTPNPNMLQDFKRKLEKFQSDKHYLQNISAKLQSVELLMKSDVLSVNQENGDSDDSNNINSKMNYSFLDENSYGETPGAIGNTPDDYELNLKTPRFSNFVDSSFIQKDVEIENGDSDHDRDNYGINRLNPNEMGDLNNDKSKNNNTNINVLLCNV